MEMAVKTMERAARSARGRQRRRGELLPRRQHHGGASPLNPLSSWLLGSPPHGDGIHGEAKTWLWREIRGYEVLATT